jgi:nitroimidazol reductase NimA-like FMN-containing flavoprotein (pyridoxamine 5'-phosphate oxidase superfamily)
MILPTWPDGTVATLSTGAGAPHAIPVSTIVRAGDAEIVFVLAKSRESLARLREDPRCALTILAPGISVTVHGHAEIAEEWERVVALRMRVESLQDHAQPTFTIHAGVAWEWTDEGAARADAEMREGLRRLAR